MGFLGAPPYRKFSGDRAWNPNRALEAQIRAMDAAGLTKRQIANRLNKAGVPAGTESGRWDVDIAGRRYPSAVSARPLYDPQMKRIHS